MPLKILRVEGDKLAVMKYQNLKEGDLFTTVEPEDREPSYFTKYTYIVTDHKMKGPKDEALASVRMTTGRIHWISRHETVYLLDGSLVVHYK